MIVGGISGCCAEQIDIEAGAGAAAVVESADGEDTWNLRAVGCSGGDLPGTSDIDRATDRADSCQRGIVVDVDIAGGCRRSIDNQRAGIDDCRAGVCVDGVEIQHTIAGLRQVASAAGFADGSV